MQWWSSSPKAAAKSAVAVATVAMDSVGAEVAARLNATNAAKSVTLPVIVVVEIPAATGIVAVIDDEVAVETEVAIDEEAVIDHVIVVAIDDAVETAVTEVAVVIVGIEAETELAEIKVEIDQAIVEEETIVEKNEHRRVQPPRINDPCRRRREAQQRARRAEDRPV
jgi:hypothetical protein